jgi:hypothetical protein
MAEPLDEEPEDNHSEIPTGDADGDEGETEKSSEGETTARASAKPALIPLIVANVALAIYLVFVGILMYKTDATDISWSRITYLFSGIESIAFAAAGFLFGREVNRARAENAEKQAGSEKKRADSAAKQRDEAQTKARELSEGIRDLVDLTEDAQATIPGGGAPPGAMSEIAPSSAAAAAAAPVILSLVAKKARRLAARSRI